VLLPRFEENTDREVNRVFFKNESDAAIGSLFLRLPRVEQSPMAARHNRFDILRNKRQRGSHKPEYLPRSKVRCPGGPA